MAGWQHKQYYYLGFLFFLWYCARMKAHTAITAIENLYSGNIAPHKKHVDPESRLGSSGASFLFRPPVFLCGHGDTYPDANADPMRLPPENCLDASGTVHIHMGCRIFSRLSRQTQGPDPLVRLKKSYRAEIFFNHKKSLPMHTTYCSAAFAVRFLHDGRSPFRQKDCGCMENAVKE